MGECKNECNLKVVEFQERRFHWMAMGRAVERGYVFVYAPTAPFNSTLLKHFTENHGLSHLPPRFAQGGALYKLFATLKCNSEDWSWHFRSLTCHSMAAPRIYEGMDIAGKSQLSIKPTPNHQPFLLLS